MQQMAGNMGLLNPFMFNQFGAYGAYAQVFLILVNKIIFIQSFIFYSFILIVIWIVLMKFMQQQAAIMAAAGGYMPMAAALAAQLPAQVQMTNGLGSPAMTPTSGY